MEARLPFPSDTNMGDVVNHLTANSTPLPDLYAMVEDLSIHGATSPHFSTAVTFVSQFFGGDGGYGGCPT